MWMRLRDEGAEVRVWIEDEQQKKVGDGLVTKTGWSDGLAWAKEGSNRGEPTLVFFDSSGLGEKADEARRAGLHVIGGGGFCDRLEKDRTFGQNIAEAAGCQLPPYMEFSSFDACREWARTIPDDAAVYWKSDRFLESDATHKADGGPELVEYLDSIIRRFGSRGSCVVQEKIEGIALSTARWWNGRSWVGPYEGTIEHKAAWNDDIGPATGCAFNAVWMYDDPDLPLAKMLGFEGAAHAFRKNNAPPGLYDINSIVAEDGTAYFLEWTPRCYSSDTEVLTATGWRPMKDVKVGESVASLTDGKELVYVPVERTVSKRHVGDMVRIKSLQSYDLLVTPDHAMTFQDASGKLFALEAQDIGRKQLRTVRTASWQGVDTPVYTIPEHIEKHSTGRHGGTFDILHPARTVPMDVWCKFVALYLSNGNLHFTGQPNPKQVYISEKKQVPEVAAVLDALGFKYTYSKDRFRISSTQIARHIFAQIGSVRAWDKRLPRYILELAPRYLEAFLDGYTLGDGSIHKRSGQRTWTSTSKGLAEDLTEVLLRLGRWAIIKNVGVGGFPGSVHPMYRVSERNVKTDGRLFGGRHVSVEQYDGDVVCLTVPNHRLYVRRPNGPAMWCGNCGYDSEPTSMRLYPNYLMHLWGVATGTGYVQPSSDIAYSIRLSVPPYPWEHAKKDMRHGAVGIEVKGVEADDLWRGDFIGYELMLDPETGLTVASPEGLVGLAYAQGDSMEELGEAALEVAESLRKTPGLQYRTDGADCVADDAQACLESGIDVPLGLVN